MAKYNLVIFDCDGTLVVSEEINNKAISNATKKIGLTGYTTDICLQKFRGLGSEQIIKILNAENGANIDEQAFIEAIIENAAFLRSEIRAVENAEHVLRQINIDKCVVSNGERESVIATLEQNNLLSFFGIDNIFTRSITEQPKPAPDMFLRAAKKFTCAANKAIVIEDSEAGVRAAKAAGMQVIGFVGTAIITERRTKKLLDAGADYIVSNISEVLKIIN